MATNRHASVPIGVRRSVAGHVRQRATVELHSSCRGPEQRLHHRMPQPQLRSSGQEVSFRCGLPVTLAHGSVADDQRGQLHPCPAIARGAAFIQLHQKKMATIKAEQAAAAQETAEAKKAASSSTPTTTAVTSSTREITINLGGSRQTIKTDAAGEAALESVLRQLESLGAITNDQLTRRHRTR